MNNAESRAEKATSLLDDAEHALDAQQVDKAESKLADAKKLLSDPDVEYYPERDMLVSREKEDEARVPQIRAEIAQRELDAAVAKRRKALNDTTAQLKKSIDDLHLPGLGSSQVKAAKHALDDLRSALDDGKDLEPKDKSYAETAKQGRKYLEDAGVEIRQSEKTVAFLEGPAEARKKAIELAKKADGEKEPHKHLELLKNARDQFKLCAEDGKKAILATSELKKAVIVLEETVTSPEGITTECISQSQALAKPISASEKIVAFVDGPGASWKQGEDLDKAAEAETDAQKKLDGLKAASAKYKLCITQGKKFLAKYRELKKTNIVLEDASMTAEKWLAGCIQRGVALDKSIIAANKAAKAAALAAKKAKKKEAK
jgi:hypothetical protein